MSNNAVYMKKLRKARVIRKQCIRCGKPLEVDTLLRGVRQCDDCLEYQRKSRKGEIESKKNTTYFFNRDYKKDKIIRVALGQYMIDNKISVKDLAAATQLSIRTIQRILYTDEKFSKKTREAINNYAGKELL